jgi:uncharacterized protein YecT (DUF1311 family)
MSFSALAQETCSTKSLDCINRHIDSYQKEQAKSCDTTTKVMEKMMDYAPALYPLGLCKLRSKKPEDIKKACDLFQKSADLGFGRAGFYASQCLSRDSEIAITNEEFNKAKLKTNEKLAQKYLKMASDSHHPIAMLFYAKELNPGTPEWLELMERIKNLNQDERVYSFIKLIEFYHDRDPNKAKALYKEALTIPYFKEGKYEQHPIFGFEFMFGFGSKINEEMFCLDYKSPEEKIDGEANCHFKYHTAIKSPQKKKQIEDEYFKCASKSRDNWALVEIYANGLGTSIDYNLAFRYACQNPDIDLKEVLPKIEDKKAGKNKNPIWFCDYGTTTPVSNHCAYEASTLDQNQTLAAMAELTKNWSEGAKKKLLKVTDVFNKFLEEELESHLGPYSSRGTGAPGDSSVFTAKAKKNYFKLIKEVTEKKPQPLLKQIDFQQSDKELNETYKKVLKSFEKNYAGEKEELKEAVTLYKSAQRLWIGYRDQFSELVAEQFKGSFSEAELKTHGSALLTQERTKLLDDCYLFEGDHSESKCPYSL